MTSRYPRCRREGCPRRVTRPRAETCSLLCKLVGEELDRAQRITEATEGTEHWALAVAVSDALTEYWRSDTRMFRAAKSVGISPDRWRAMRDGVAVGSNRRRG